MQTLETFNMGIQKLGFVLKGRIVPWHLKGNIFHSFILPIATYGLEAMAVTIVKQQRMTQQVMEKKYARLRKKLQIPKN